MRAAVEVVGVTTILAKLLQHLLPSESNRKDLIVGSAWIASTLVFFRALWSNRRTQDHLPIETTEIIIAAIAITVYVRLLDDSTN